MKMTVAANPCSTRAYNDPRRHNEGMPLLRTKFERNLALRFPPHRQRAITALFADQRRLEKMPVHEFMEALIP